MKKCIIFMLSAVSLLLTAQNTQHKKELKSNQKIAANSKASKNSLTKPIALWEQKINEANSIIAYYSAYPTKFIYDPQKNLLSWSTSQKQTVSVYLHQIDIHQILGGTNSLLVFKTLDGSKIFYDGAFKKDSTFNIISQQECKKVFDILKSLNYVAYPKDKVRHNIIVYTLSEINKLFALHDEYKNTFTFEEQTGNLTWVGKNKDFTISAPLNNINIQPYTSNTAKQVQFKCVTGTKCITLNGSLYPDRMVAVSLDSKESVNAAMELFKQLKQNYSDK